jgi:hypothetical protein
VVTYSGLIEKLDRDADSGRHFAGVGMYTSRTTANVVSMGNVQRQQRGKVAMRSHTRWHMNLLGPTALEVNFVREQVGSLGEPEKLRVACRRATFVLSSMDYNDHNWLLYTTIDRIQTTQILVQSCLIGHGIIAPVWQAHHLLCISRAKIGWASTVLSKC